MKKILGSLTSLLSCLLFIILSPTSPVNAQTPEAELIIEVVTDQLKRPWSLAFLPDGNYLVTERGGTLRIVDDKDGVISAPIQGLPSISPIGQGGLLDVALDPNFKRNRFIYLSYVAGESSTGFSTEVVRAVLAPVATKRSNNAKNTLSTPLPHYLLTDLKKLFVALPKVKGGRHFGGRLAFDNENYLFISLGDRGDRQHAQNLQTHHGSVIRLNSNGTIPKDNPFVQSASARPEIYSYGHRNVQGLAMHPTSGVMWSHEHGPQGGDEVNKLISGKNYGWPVRTYGVEYGSGLPIGDGAFKANMEEPLYYWDPSIAPSGMAFFNDDLLIGSLKFQLLSILSLSKRPTDIEIKNKPLLFEEIRIFEQRFGRIRDVRMSDNKTFYLLTDASRGKLVRVTKNMKELTIINR